MRCSKCGKLFEKYAPKWAFHCECDDTSTPSKEWMTEVGLKDGPLGLTTAEERKDILAEMVAAIRADKLVGKGSCSSIDECMEDSEIANDLVEDGITTPADAVKWAREQEGLFLEQGTNCRWGEDDDPQLKQYNEFKEAEKNNPPSRHDGLGLVWDEEN